MLRCQVTSLSEDLRVLSVQLMKLSQATEREYDKDQETLNSYYYSKGALDYRDKLLALMGALPPTYSALQAYYLLLEQFPDSYQNK